MEIGAKIRHVRKAKGMSLKDLAEKAGFTSSFLSQVETSKVNPTIDSLKRIARALEVPIVTFFEGSSPDRSRVVRSRDRKRLRLPSSTAMFELLTPDLNRSVEVLLLRLGPDEVTSNGLVSHISEEVLLVLEGKVKVNIESVEELLGDGDSIYIDSLVQHAVTNIGDTEAEIICVLTPPVF